MTLVNPLIINDRLVGRALKFKKSVRLNIVKVDETKINRTYEDLG